MKVPLLDLKTQYKTIKDEILKITAEIYESQYFILGPHVEKLENEIANYCKTKYALGVSSGTDALLLALMASGIKEGDSVITSPYTFFATAGSIVRVGAKPVFVDIEPDTYNISPQKISEALNSLKEAERKTLKAIIPVHLYGQCADMDPILEIAKKNNLLVIEDAAQAIGAEYKNKRAGSLGDFGCFSFFPSKNLGAFGDGGIITANASSFYERMHILRVHGSHPKYYHKYIGGNFRLDALQAAIVSVKLKYLDEWTAARQNNAKKYRTLFSNAALSEYIILPAEKENRHIYNQFIIKVSGKRDELRTHLNNAGIGSEVYYPVPLHLQQCFSYLGYKKGNMPVSEDASANTLALPIYPELTEDMQVYVVEKIKEFYR
ncbi:DegT/DnrJ/EryC1/StrS family aminotransferase [Desulfobacterium sp. N47]